MTTPTRSVIVAGLAPQLFGELELSLLREGFFSELVADEHEALELLTVLPYDVVIVGYPLPEMAMRSFLTATRKESSASRKAALVIVAPEKAVEEAEEHIGSGANRVLPDSVPPIEIARAVFALVNAAPRVQLRALSRLRLNLEKEGSVTLCQTENVSATGMLIRTDLSLAVGSEIGFELSLPGEAKPVRGKARVMRQTMKGHERISGIGLAFEHFDGDDGERLAAFVARIAT